MNPHVELKVGTLPVTAEAARDLGWDDEPRRLRREAEASDLRALRAAMDALMAKAQR